MTPSEAELPPARVLVVGRDPLVLETVTDEIAASGIAVRGVTADEAQAVAGPFDVVAFGSGVAAGERDSLQDRFRLENPRVRIVRAYAPFAASQVVTAVRDASPHPPVDLAAYCRRIAYDGPLNPKLDTLSALQARHIASITFEAIDVLLGRGIDLAPAAIDAKLIGSKRGGYCFEQNGLFKRVLEAIGFEVDGLIARVRWMAEPGTPPPAPSHMVLRVTIDGVPWLADVGFGSSVPPAPLRLDTTAPQPTRHETYRVLPFGPGHLVQADVLGKWRALYDVLPEPMLDRQFEMPNWFTSTHPSSHFARQLVAARTTPEARYALLEGRLTTRPAGGGVERRLLDADAIERALRDVFTLPVEPEWRPLIERAARQSAAEPSSALAAA